MSRRQLLLLLVSLLWPKVGRAAGEWIDMYPADRLIGEKSRLESRANQMLDILRTLLGKTDLPDDQQRLLESVRVEAPLSDDAGVPLNFFSRYTANAGVVTTPVFSLLFVEDLCTAYSWLYQRAYSLETIDEYVTMLRYRSAAEFPGGQYLSPLPALGIPLNAYDDPEAGPLKRIPLILKRIRHERSSWSIRPRRGEARRGRFGGEGCAGSARQPCADTP